MTYHDRKISVIGLGYVGLPVAVEFGKYQQVIGFDINTIRIEDLQNGIERTNEVDIKDLAATNVLYTNNAFDIKKADFHIIAVPTPVNDSKQPDFLPLISATKTVGQQLKKGDIVVFESTVYPGATEEICIPVLENESNLIWRKDFNVGYSPERINPGDKVHAFKTITKVVSGDTVDTLNIVATVYASVVDAGIYKAASIKVAEAAKVIENTQRDLNISLMNELALIFNKMNIDTQDVLAAASSKWNFLPFEPGLVGGHCIGVDPYYLTHKAQSIGYNPEVILSGRRINDGMGAYVVSQLIKLMLKKRIHVQDANVLIMGLTFKENCPDIRNTRVVDIVAELETYGIHVDVYDPWVDTEETVAEYGIHPVTQPKSGKYDAMILAVAHEEFREMPIAEIRALGKPQSIIYDLKYLFPADQTDARL